MKNPFMILIAAVFAAASPGSNAASRPNVIFILADDLPEKNDLAGKHPQRVAGMLEKMNAARSRNERFPLPGLDSLE